jgi:RHH-type rel operon transcriptional repressor/antitoxin RelB
MPTSAVLTLRLDPKLKKKLDQLSKAMKRTRSFVAAEAICDYVALNEWQTREIEKGIAEARPGRICARYRRAPSSEEVDDWCELSGCAQH